MKSITKTLWIISIISVFMSMIWFLLGATACFQRNIDLVRTVVFLYVWTSALGFVTLSVIMLKKGWSPNGTLAKICFSIVIITLSSIFITTFIRYSSPYGWLKESVTKDYLQTTVDEKYEYRLELVNMFQRNSYARVYIKNIATYEEAKISLDIPTNEITVIFGGDGYLSSETNPPSVWSKLIPSDEESIYILTTTEHFDSDNIYQFQIDLKSKTAK